MASFLMRCERASVPDADRSKGVGASLTPGQRRHTAPRRFSPGSSTRRCRFLQRRLAHPELVRQRICQQIGKWRGDRPPLVLENVEPGLAVARGAALFGRLLDHKAERIEAGAAHAVFLEVHQKPRDGIKERAILACLCSPARRLPGGTIRNHRSSARSAHESACPLPGLSF